MGFWNEADGMISVRVTSADITAALRVINDRGISVYNVISHPDGLTASFQIRRNDLPEIKKTSDKRGDDLIIIAWSGLYWKLKSLMERKVLVIGLFTLLLLSFILPTRVYFFQVEGNSAISDRQILAAAESCGIRFGVSRQVLRSVKMKNALLEAIPQLQWAGINTSGCTATITVRERKTPENRGQNRGVGSIVATRDGVIQELTVVRGNGVCKVGQAVKAGQVLISAYTDCGISIQATRAQGEVFADTVREITVLAPAKWEHRSTETDTVKKYALIFGKNRINLYKGSGISDTSCVKMYLEYCLTLPGGFRLPVTLIEETWISCVSAGSLATQEQDSARIADFARSYISEQMIAGQILSFSEQPAEREGVLVLYGKYACREMIGQIHSEEIIQ